MFGHLPAGGIYVRHAREIRGLSTEFKLDKPEERPTIVCDDIHDLELRAITTPAPDSSEAVIELRNCAEALLQCVRVVQNANAFVHVSGAASQHIALSSNELSRAAHTAIFSDGAFDGAIVSH